MSSVGCRSAAPWILQDSTSEDYHEATLKFYVDHCAPPEYTLGVNLSARCGKYADHQPTYEFDYSKNRPFDAAEKDKIKQAPPQRNER
jgi:hypothetical protein